MAINFTSSKDSDETHAMHTKSDSIEFLIGNETNEIVEELFDSLLQRYKKGLEESMKRSEFIFDNVDLLYYKCQKTKCHKISTNNADTAR